MWALGLMSGTSLDGIDAALIRSDGDRITEFGPTSTVTYDPVFRDRLRALLGRDPSAEPAAAGVVAELTDRHAEAVAGLLSRSGLGPDQVDVIGFHGQTVLHRPRDGFTCQIGDGDRLARATGIPVVCDFRANDMAHGGQGAPLAPLYHAALARDLERPLAVLNIGGVANITWIGADGTVLAFDTGPGNALLDDWVRRTIGRPMDEGGRLARAGRPDALVLAELFRHPYFRQRPPKSLDRDDFAASLIEGLSAADGAATLAAFTIGAVSKARDFLPEAPRRWLVTGGGRHNGLLMAGLRAELEAPVEPVEAVGWDGDAIEAQAFAYLALRALRGLPLTLPTTTGTREAVSGGRVFRPAA